MGHGRKTRRVLERGGRGIAQQLNETLGGWPGVRITPMFGRWGYFIGDELFACFPVREKDHDLWIRLTRDEQAEAGRGEEDEPRSDATLAVSELAQTRENSHGLIGRSLRAQACLANGKSR